ncbi:unnamed protein product [Rangifer tarandus platyrhynchus]|uniref:Uncharacterized protein n=1 Tax=Rangifer tarandus platyrhynchus TaxID=3082113 RepID=A0ABN8ZYE3_RANTA|nr:unnamed protein product [Rangifer tarandus platyrhynchus]
MRGAAGSRDSDRRLCRAARRPGRPPGGSVAQAQEERETEAAGLLSSTRKSAREESAQPGRHELVFSLRTCFWFVNKLRRILFSGSGQWGFVGKQREVVIPLGRRLVSPARLSLRDARNLGERAFAFLTAADAVICQCTRANGSVPRYRDAKEPPQGFLSSFAPTVKGLELQEEETYLCAFTLAMFYSQRQTPHPVSSRVYLWKGNDSTEHTSSLLKCFGVFSLVPFGLFRILQ